MDYNSPCDCKSEVPTISIMEPSSGDSENLSSNKETPGNKNTIDLILDEGVTKSKQDFKESNNDPEALFLVYFYPENVSNMV